VFVNAPPGISIRGTWASRAGQDRLEQQWRNCAPRRGLAWGVHGRWRAAVGHRTSLGLRFEPASTTNQCRFPAGSATARSSTIAELMDNPWSSLGCDPLSDSERDPKWQSSRPANRRDDPDTQFTTSAAVERGGRAADGKNWRCTAAYWAALGRLGHDRTALNHGVYLGRTVRVERRVVKRVLDHVEHGSEARAVSEGSGEGSRNRRDRYQIASRLARTYRGMFFFFFFFLSCRPRAAARTSASTDSYNAFTLRARDHHRVK